MALVDRKRTSLYDEARTGLTSLIKQTVQIFVGWLVMLLLTGGNPSAFVVASSFCLGVGFVAWSEKERLTKGISISIKKMFNNILLLIGSFIYKLIRPFIYKLILIDIVNVDMVNGLRAEEDEDYGDDSEEDEYYDSEEELTAGVFVDDKSSLVREILSQGITYQDLRDVNLSHVNLSGANLSHANLVFANLSGANLSHANLSGANLSHANLVFANLNGANLSHANLKNVYLIYADLSSTNLSNTNLSDAHLHLADLSSTIFNNANVKNAKFRANLGISESIKIDLIRRGAIFEDFSPNNHSGIKLLG
jgi:uncharacterized protein YjbI with pentapeptide repeats